MASNTTLPNADAGRLDRRVRPVAYVQRMGSFQGVPHYGCLLTIEATQRMKVNDPLYGQAELDEALRVALDSACAAEQKRWADGVADMAKAAADNNDLRVYELLRGLNDALYRA